MKIVIFGNMGYVGPGVIERLRSTYPTATLIGYDTGFFASCLTDVDYLPERKLDHQYFGDIRDVPDDILKGRMQSLTWLLFQTIQWVRSSKKLLST